MSDTRRHLPAVNALLIQAEQAGLLESAPRKVLVDSIRSVLDRARGEGSGEPDGGWLAAIEQRVVEGTRPSLQRVINATGVVLHTNLGRAPLPEAALRAAEEAYRYSTLEFDVTNGERGSRQDHHRSLLQEITGAENALVVNNAACALFLLLNTLARDGDTIVSRGELVEIGGSFRIPDILARSGSALVEVGTTNRTRLRDYLSAVSPRTRLILKVHPSNFRMTGFTEEVEIGQLVDLGRDRGIPVVHDVGSGLLLDLANWDLAGEPRVQDSVAVGATVVFSGDKMLGGPQAGIIVGPEAIIQRVSSSPLARALRPDKFTLAALEATLAIHRDPAAARVEIPVLAMLTADRSELASRAEQLAQQLAGATVEPGHSAVGGGAFPGVSLPTTLVRLPANSPDTALAKLRRHTPPVIARAADNAVLFDLRTIRDEEFAVIVSAVRGAAMA